ncbi:MAG: VWA domain-containing protein [Planctomycetota bacterium]
MIGFAFDAPWWALLLLPLAALPSWLAARDRAAAALRRELLGPRAAPAPASRSGRASRWCGVAALALAVLALMGPRWGAPVAADAATARDLVVCLDVSRSMRARDVTPSRLEAARAAIAALAERARGDRLALVAFAGDARLRVPRTTDADSFVQLLRGTDELSVARGGTDLGAALDAALAALVGRRGGAAVVLVTDGEDHAARGLAAAQRCAAQGIAVHCVGLGSERGGKVPVPRLGGDGETFLRDAQGNEVVSALDAASLGALAAAAGGTFARADSAEAATAALRDVYERRVLPAAAAGGAEGDELRVPARFQWLLLPAVLLWLLQVWLRRAARAPRPA